MEVPIAWLLDGLPWVQYRTRRDLLGQREDEPQVMAARAAMLAHPQIQALLAELAAWPGPPLQRHNDARHPLHKLTFLADLGLRAGDDGLSSTIQRILDLRAPEGPFQILVNIPTRFGGSGQDQPAWMLCDAPSIIYALLKLGLGEDPRAQAAISYLVGLRRENGWPCAAAPALGRFRGPGRKDDPCPYANLLMVKMLAQSPAWRDSDACHAGAETLLGLWEERRTRRPYLFGMGSDFSRLKAPLIWYDILHLLDVLTPLPWLRGDPRLGEMVAIVRGKADAEGRFTPESVWREWKDWDFGQKRVPSRWLTLLARRILTQW